MTDLVTVETPDAPRAAAPYSQGVVANGFLYTAGFGPHDPATGAVVQGTVEVQTARSLENIQAVLRSHGLGFHDVVKATVHLQDLRDLPGFNETYVKYFREPYPVRTTVGSQLPGFAVEIDVVARIPESDGESQL